LVPIKLVLTSRENLLKIQHRLDTINTFNL
jgi:hypothetical protein